MSELEDDGVGGTTSQRPPLDADPGYVPGSAYGPDPPPTVPPSGGYNPGPQTYRNYYHKTQPATPPPDPWAGISAGAHSVATALADKFSQVIGYPDGWDGNGAALAMAKAGVNLSSPYDAYEWLFQNKLSADQRTNNPWAEFGMIKDDYNMTVGKLNSVMFDWTGDNMDTGTIKSAIVGGWTPDQIRNFAQYGNAEGTGELLASARFTGDKPWLSVGQTYSATLQQFESFEHEAPTDKQTLAAFFRFGQSARSIGGGGEAVVQARPVETSGTAVR